MDNKRFSLAFDLLANTSQSIFLTGKAGTGKTTFLKYVNEHVYKNKIITASTGIAAINAGGVTIHSLLQLPPETFIPDYEGKKKLDHHLKLHETKIELLRKMELMIIDEISMVRADLLDAVDYTLKRYRNNSKPFGGVQMLFIGDLFQLPPIVSQQEWAKLKDYYHSSLFFDALVLRELPLVSIELDKVYRQQDPVFVELLNRVRNNCVRQTDLDTLNQRYDPYLSDEIGTDAVILTTHNQQADTINKEKLESIDSEPKIYQAVIRGEFNENAYPADFELALKENAQVMFIKNEVGELKRYYNGKIGRISSLDDDMVCVECANGELIELEKVIWRNVRYQLNKDTEEIEEQELGIFAQFPIRLAWAVTIHKSQGLTFDRIVIDAAKAFAEGQVYVALSRCTSLEGITLKSKLSYGAIRTSSAALEFQHLLQNEEEIEKILNTNKPIYIGNQLKKQFNIDPIIEILRNWINLTSEKKIPNKEDKISIICNAQDKALELQNVADRFIKQIDAILNYNDLNILRDRVGKASEYFFKEAFLNIIQPLHEYVLSIENMSKVKKYLDESRNYLKNLKSLIFKFTEIYYGNENLTKHIVFPSFTLPEPKKEKQVEKEKTNQITLKLVKQGKSVSKIAQERNLTESTIQSHILDFTRTGEIIPSEIIAKRKVDFLTKELKPYTNNKSLTELKNLLPEEYSFFEIRIVLDYLRLTNN